MQLYLAVKDRYINEKKRIIEAIPVRDVMEHSSAISPLSFSLGREEKGKHREISRPDQQCTTFSTYQMSAHQAQAANLLVFLYWMKDVEDRRNKSTWESGPGVFRGYIVWLGFSYLYWLHKANRKFIERKKEEVGSPDRTMSLRSGVISFIWFFQCFFICLQKL